MATPDAVDDPLVRLFLRQDTHYGGDALFFIFIIPLYNLVQYNCALFAGLFFQPAPQHDRPVDDLLPTKNKRPRGRLKFEYIYDRDDNIFEVLGISFRMTWSLYWSKLLPAYLVIVCEVIARRIAPYTGRITDDILVTNYPLLVVIFSILPLIGFMASTFRLGAGKKIQFSKKRSIAISFSPTIKYILSILQDEDEGLAYNRAVSRLNEMIHELPPATRHTMMIFIDWVDVLIKLGSQITEQFRYIAATSTTARSQDKTVGSELAPSAEFEGELSNRSITAQPLQSGVNILGGDHPAADASSKVEVRCTSGDSDGDYDIGRRLRRGSTERRRGR